jgi:hypothetical protein
MYFSIAQQYCEQISKEIGIDSLKDLRETSRKYQIEPLFSICEKTLDIIETEYYCKIISLSF